MFLTLAQLVGPFPLLEPHTLGVPCLGLISRYGVAMAPWGQCALLVIRGLFGLNLFGLGASGMPSPASTGLSSIAHSCVRPGPSRRGAAQPLCWSPLVFWGASGSSMGGGPWGVW